MRTKSLMILCALFYLLPSKGFSQRRGGGDDKWDFAAMVLDFNANYNALSGKEEIKPGASYFKNVSTPGMTFGLGYESNPFRGMPWLGMGIKLTYNTFSMPKDSGAGSPSARSYDMLAMINVHVFRNETWDVPVGFHYGGSWFKETLNDALGTTAKATGYIMQVGVFPRYYFNDHLGVNMHITYTIYHYDDIYYHNSMSQDPFGDDLTALSLSGISIGAGLQYHF
ncbi:MAG: outer membrane beta-barrel protein [Bacteroidia bacterium]